MSWILNVFGKKDGKISKTAIFLSLATFLLLLIWPFQALFAGVTLFGFWIVPEFSAGAATAVMGILSSLYVLNHKWRGNSNSSTIKREDDSNDN